MNRTEITTVRHITDYRDLDVWQLSMDLVVSIYDLTRTFPKEELFGLTSQMQRAAVSIPSNIAEGRGRNTRKDYAHFIVMARGSACELSTLLEVCKRTIAGIDTVPCQEMSERVEQMLWKLGKSLQAAASMG